MGTVEYNDLREFIAACERIDRCQVIEGADWNIEIGAIIEATAERIKEPPLLVFDRIKGYPQGYRVASLVIASKKRAAFALGLPVDRPKLELVRLAARKIQEADRIPPRVINDGPVMQNSMTGDDVDLTRFPALHFHTQDGGRYIGTGDTVINRDPESRYVNMGTYRIQLHERNLLGLWMSPGQQGRQICERYWQEGKSCPIVATFGQDPLTFMASGTKLPWGASELEYIGGLRGRPIDVIKGPLTGLPIPASAEVAIEGEVPPPHEESRDEGPFGEWPGYYSGGTLGTGEPQPVIRVKAIYHRNDPILLDSAPLWPGAERYGLRIGSGILWDQLEKAGIEDVVGVWAYNYSVVVAIRQRYPGHARQAGLAAMACAEGARNGRYVVVVDEDIDPSNLTEVLWAMKTRVDPATDIEILDGCWSTPLDPRMPPEKKASGDFTNSRAIFYAVRPFVWRDQFPLSCRSEPELIRKVIEKYRSVLPFPSE